MIRTLVVFGTRPEAIKMAPVVLELLQRPGIETIVCVTGQHRGLLDDALSAFEIRPDYDLAIMRPGQTLGDITSDVLAKLTPLLVELKPDRVLVHGDTTTTYAASIASFYCGIPVGHVEAGLRTGNLMAPWPEEFNRRSVDLVADLLWAPTEAAADNLRREGAKVDDIVITGNTAVDAIGAVKARIEIDTRLLENLWQQLPKLDPAKRLVLVTGHRRESFGEGMASICRALNWIAARPDIEIVWPVHPNPNVLAAVREHLKFHSNVHLIEPTEYLSFTALMLRSHFIITDSGGIQEEAPTLAKPVLVTRNETERPEAVQAGTAELVGTSFERIISAATLLLDDGVAYAQMAARQNPFGDGKAAVRIVDSLVSRHAKAPAR
jgi:UDP-N-acetylglucosamine 2-epimerase (non-hydrolysing)